MYRREVVNKATLGVFHRWWQTTSIFALHVQLVTKQKQSNIQNDTPRSASGSVSSASSLSSLTLVLTSLCFLVHRSGWKTYARQIWQYSTDKLNLESYEILHWGLTRLHYRIFLCNLRQFLSSIVFTRYSSYKFRCSENCYTTFVISFILLITVKKIHNSFKIWQNYRQISQVHFLRHGVCVQDSESTTGFLHVWPWPWFIPHRRCIGPHVDATNVCLELMFQPLPRLIPFFGGPSLTHLSSSSLACQVFSWISQLQRLLRNAYLCHLKTRLFRMP